MHGLYGKRDIMVILLLNGFSDMKKEKAEKVRDLVNEREYYNGIKELVEETAVKKVNMTNADGMNYMSFCADGDNFNWKICRAFIHLVKEECRRRIEDIDKELERI